MYIKIKHLKYSLLFLTCVFLAGFNYLTFVNADDSNSAIDTDKDGLTDVEEKLYGTNPEKADSDSDGYSDGIEIKSGYDPLKPAPGDKLTTTNNTAAILTQEQSSVTEEVIQKLKAFTNSKGDKAITTADVQSLVDETIAEKTGDAISWDTLPEINNAELKILKQDYSTLSEADRKTKLQEDATAYITKIIYLLANNLPASVQTEADMQKIGEDFLGHLSSFSTLSPDFEYFVDIEKRFGFFSDQAKEIEVPETMLDLHIKLIRLTKGFSNLNETIPTNQQDPIVNMIMINKIQAFANLFSDFMTNELQNYLNQLN